jgi:hypothetical protein
MLTQPGETKSSTCCKDQQRRNPLQNMVFALKPRASLATVVQGGTSGAQSLHQQQHHQHQHASSQQAPTASHLQDSTPQHPQPHQLHRCMNGQRNCKPDTGVHHSWVTLHARCCTHFHSSTWQSLPSCTGLQVKLLKLCDAANRQQLLLHHVHFLQRLLLPIDGSQHKCWPPCVPPKNLSTWLSILSRCAASRMAIAVSTPSSQMAACCC